MPKTKIVDRETLPYRPCVGLMILNGEGLVWVGHRIAEPDSEFAGTTQLWQMPQGGIDKGEEPLQAAERELYEETGMLANNEGRAQAACPGRRSQASRPVPAQPARAVSPNRARMINAWRFTRWLRPS